MAKQAHLRVSETDVHDIVLLPGDPGRVDRIAHHCDSSELIAENREYRIVNASYSGVDLTICSTGIGSPSAAIAIEELSRIGVTTVIRVGTTGALQAHVEIGDMVVPTAAAKDEGTTRRYELDTVPAVPDFTVLSAIVDAANARGEIVHIGPITTDDAYYAETEEYVAAWEAAKLLAVEMEAAAVFTLARRNGLRSGAICTVDGNLVLGTQKGVSDVDELPDKAKDNIARAIDIALDAAVSLDES